MKKTSYQDLLVKVGKIRGLNKHTLENNLSYKAKEIDKAVAGLMCDIIINQKLEENKKTVYKIDSDYYGNPRYLISWISLGLEDYTPLKGYPKYRGKKYGGMYVIQSYNIEESVKSIMQGLGTWNDYITINIK